MMISTLTRGLEVLTVSDYPKRKNIRIPEYDYSKPGAYFVTVCTANRVPMLWHRLFLDVSDLHVPLSAAGKIVEQAIEQIPIHHTNVTVDRYCIMPDHIHLLLTIHTDEEGQEIPTKALSKIVGSMKRWASKQIGGTPWQKSFYEHGIRNHQDFVETWEYIENNPLKYALSKQRGYG